MAHICVILISHNLDICLIYDKKGGGLVSNQSRTLKSAANNTDKKREVGLRASLLVQDNMMLGVGTGSTVKFFIDYLSERIMNEDLNIGCVSTSFQTTLYLKEKGIEAKDLSLVSRLDLVVDGADEIDPWLNAIKGGGAAHTIEKVVASMTDKFVLIADEGKLVDNLGCSFPIPVEVIPCSVSIVKKKIVDMGGKPKIRMGVNKDGPIVTDSGNFVLDVYFDSAPDVFDLDNKLCKTPGVLETGLFLQMTHMAIIAYSDGVKELTPRTLGESACK